MLARYAEAYRFYRYGRTMDFGPALDRLVRPLNDVFDYTGIKTQLRRYVLLFFLREMAERNSSFWGWTTDEVVFPAVFVGHVSPLTVNVACEELVRLLSSLLESGQSARRGDDLAKRKKWLFGRLLHGRTPLRSLVFCF